MFWRQRHWSSSATTTDDETLEALEEARAASQSRLVESPGVEARRVLERLREAATRCRYRPDAKVLGLLDWIRRNQCAAVRVGGADSLPPAGQRSQRGQHGQPGQRGGESSAASRDQASWSERRLLIFTEYGDTKRYLAQLLSAAIAGTDHADERVLQLHGGMSEEQREQVQRAFNGPPDRYPVRILIATDAAREGINLQAHCADLIHFDVPWNPARMEQRNGRIDRTLQPKDKVFCQYFAYQDRSEDPVLAKLVEKSETIARELGSLGAVVMDAVTEELEQRGLNSSTATQIEQLARARDGGTSDEELETVRERHKALLDEVEDIGEIVNRSRKVLEFDSALLRDAIDVGFELSGADKLERISDNQPNAPLTYRLPELPGSWDGTLDALRPARDREESYWDWRKRPPLPVTFEPLEGYGAEAVHLHLSHPLVQRVLGQFVAQGFSAHDLSRVTVVRNKHDALVRVIAFGRLSLFGGGATRLHDELISVAARWVEGKKAALRPFAEEGDRNAIRLLEQIFTESPSLKGISEATLAHVRQAAPELFGALWQSIREEADARAVDAVAKLTARGRSESDALKQILRTQQAAIKRRLSQQLTLDFGASEREEREQFERDRKHMQRRLDALGSELEREPRQIEALYQVQLHRLQPVGLVVLWPSTRS